MPIRGKVRLPSPGDGKCGIVVVRVSGSLRRCSGELSAAETSFQMAETRPAGMSRLPDFHRMQLAVDVAAPEIEKPAQLGKIRGEIELLPDEALQQIGMVGQVVDDLGSGQPIIPKLALWRRSRRFSSRSLSR